MNTAVDVFSQEVPETTLLRDICINCKEKIISEPTRTITFWSGLLEREDKHLEGGTQITEKGYTDLQKHTFHLCLKCGQKEKRINQQASVGLGLLVVVLLIVAQIISKSNETIAQLLCCSSVLVAILPIAIILGKKITLGDGFAEDAVKEYRQKKHPSQKFEVWDKEKFKLILQRMEKNTVLH